ncbi:type VI secretion system tip protein VgrG [Salmonella enterica subsp. indica]|uniref:VgrS protein n=2 Tax=Salmonella enterica TaxID=28901 RepID=A0A379XLZ7_SALER|nr:type VI secretion system tip protein VgrG [Salmonella enterica]EBP3214568.1 type VI secretion system tip protein VgrG [Salmonella enterica subsp. arizonae]ECI8273401.1 type VI secretion system tip protein VgrG [Salmonella enterica subsp. enterica]EDR2773437.1 type VI secretion system tip protein VgrG [Salmonella enterica subsp. enterica serovar Oslo]EEC4250802.1 type VI secretion system tip protein VgrG [Salmonella enterica subsp. diarizonae]ECC3878708.1 type VI secretion system tip protein
MSLKGLRFTLEVDGLPEIATTVVGFRLYQRYSAPFVLEVDIASGLPDLTATAFLEKNAVLTIWQGMVAWHYVSGIINEVTLGENNHWQMSYHLTIVPPLWRCGLRQNFRIFQQQDIQTISSTLLNENGVTEWTPLFYEPHPAREFCVQYGESDLAFLTRLWSEEGIFFFDWHAPEGPEQTLVLCDDVAGVSSLGEIPFNPNTSTEVSTQCISSFRYRARTGPSSVETQDYTFKAPGWPGYYSRAAEHLNGQLTQYEIFDYPGRFKDESHGQAFARYQIEGWRHDTETATCTSNSPKLCPGKRFTLTGHPSETLNRQWQVVSSVLTGDQPQALHGSQGEGTTLHNHFEAIPADRTWRVPPLPKPSVDGPQSAVVTGPTGEEIFCDEHGRVRIRFHWDRYCPGNEDSSCWVRVSQAWAGTGFGNLAIPRVGQEVIVDFLNGDPDQPIVMGRTYNQDNRSPGSLPGTKTQMTIRSKTYKGGGFNELKFDDATGNEQVYIHAQKNMDTEVLNDRTTTVKHDHTETIGNNQKITVGVGQTINVGSNKEGGHDQTVTVANDQKTTIINNQITLIAEGDQETNIIKGNQEITIYEGSQTIKAKKTISVGSDERIEFICGSGKFSMDSDGTITITGNLITIKGKEVDIN